MKVYGGSTDRLMAESERLRAELTRWSTQVRSFSEQLCNEVRDLRERTAETKIVERSPDHDDPERDDPAG
jgi:hypothetical protein